jgi:hypothetical protein
MQNEENTLMWSLQILCTFVETPGWSSYLECDNCIWKSLLYFETKLHNVTKFGMLFPTTLMKFLNSIVCLKAKVAQIYIYFYDI